MRRHPLRVGRREPRHDKGMVYPSAKICGGCCGFELSNLFDCLSTVDRSGYVPEGRAEIFAVEPRFENRGLTEDLRDDETPRNSDRQLLRSSGLGSSQPGIVVAVGTRAEHDLTVPIDDHDGHSQGLAPGNCVEGQHP